MSSADFVPGTAWDRRLVGGVVVHHEMHVEVARHRFFNLVQEAAELARAMARVAPANDAARGGVKGSKERSRAVAGAVVRAPFDLAGPQRQQRLASIEHLDLALLVDAQHESAGRRCHGEADDVADLGDEIRIGRELEGLGAVGLQAESPPDALHGGGRQTARLGHAARTPVGRVNRQALQRAHDHGLDPGLVHGPRRATARLVPQPIQPVGQKASAPLANRRRVDLEPRRDILVGHALTRQENDPGSQGQRPVPSCAGPRVPPVRPARSRSGSTTQVNGPSRSPATQHPNSRPNL